MKWMQSNPFRLLVLTWFSFWLVVFIPGHTRGVVEMPDAQAAAASCCTPAPSCCAPTTGRDVSCCTPGQATQTRDEDAPADPARRCMVCFLKARLTDAPPVVIYTPYLGELDEIAYADEPSLCGDLTVLEVSRGRGPPRHVTV